MDRFGRRDDTYRNVPSAADPKISLVVSLREMDFD
jgi:hypothetical protein